MEKKTSIDKSRTYTRFQPSADTLAWIDKKTGKTKFAPTLACLVLNESFTGCAVITLAASGFVKGDAIRIQVGKLAVLPAEVRWVKALDKEVVKIGIEYLE